MELESQRLEFQWVLIQEQIHGEKEKTEEEKEKTEEENTEKNR